MTNKISSADEAIPVLMKLKAKSLSVRVNLSMSNVGLSFEGVVTNVDPSGLMIVGVDPKIGRAPLLRLAPLSTFAFLGEWDETDLGISLNLMVMRADLLDRAEAARIHLTAGRPIDFGGASQLVS
jgi:hypothetical protein